MLLCYGLNGWKNCRFGNVTFEDEDLRDVCQKFYDFASVDVRSKVKRHLDKNIHKMQNELQRLKEIARRDLGRERSELLFADIREKCERLRCKMLRNHERKMENFYQLGDFDIDDEDFRILRNRIEGLLGKQSKRKRKRKRRQRKTEKTEKALTEEQLENILENVAEKVKESVLREKPKFTIPEKLFEPLNNVEYDLSEAEKKLLSKGPSFCPMPFNVNWSKATKATIYIYI